MATRIFTAVPRTVAPAFATTQTRQCITQALSRSRRNASQPTPALQQTRTFHVTRPQHHPPAPSKNKDRGPKSAEDTQTDFDALDILSNTPAPSTAIDACMSDGFALNSGLKVTGSGVLLVGGEAFKWRPWSSSTSGGKITNAKGQFDVDGSVWGVLDLVWPKPDLLVLGTGERILPVSPETRRRIGELGVRVEVQDTRNAAAQFNLLATERGVQQVVAALVPIGWRDGK